MSFSLSTPLTRIARRLCTLGPGPEQPVARSGVPRRARDPPPAARQDPAHEQPIRGCARGSPEPGATDSVCLRVDKVRSSRLTDRFGRQFGNTPLHIAARTGSADCVTSLLEADAKVSLLNVVRADWLVNWWRWYRAGGWWLSRHRCSSRSKGVPELRMSVPLGISLSACRTGRAHCTTRATASDRTWRS